MLTPRQHLFGRECFDGPNPDPKDLPGVDRNGVEKEFQPG